MKYCEKCGNELKEGFSFCDKCGAKVEKVKKEPKKEEKVIKEEKKEPVVKEKPVPPVPPMPPFPPKKPGKGKIVFLTILNILLLGAAITFLVLWLIKPSDDCNCNCNNNGGGKTDPPVTEKKYVGKWEQNLEYKSGTKVLQRVYGMIDLKDNGKFESLFYDKDDKYNTTEELTGTYTVNGSSVVLSYTEDGKKQTTTMLLGDDKLCFRDETENCLVKDSYNNKITIYKDEKPVTSSIKNITYNDYINLQKNYKDAIVVVVHEGCAYCEKYEPVVEEIAESYSTPVYYYENDGKININSTPTTVVIKNGYIVDSIVGYMSYSSISEKLDDLGVK